MPSRPDNSQPTPHCAICRGDSAVCGHEDERLKIALHEAQVRWQHGDQLRTIRHWVLNHAREMILYTYQNLAAQRQHQYEQHLSTLQCYNLWVIYRGAPPIPPDQLHRLTLEMQQAREYLQQNLDQDWAACLQKYPDTLDYFFSLVGVEVPADDDPAVEHPVITAGVGTGAGTGTTTAATMGVGEKKRKKEKRREREGGAFGPGQSPFGYGRFPGGPGVSAMPGMHVPPGGPFNQYSHY